MKPKLHTVVLGVAIALVGLTGFTSRPRVAPDLQAEGCGTNDGKLCQQICAWQGCGGCCDWLFYYYSKPSPT
jgi:hypothetical protein